MSTTKKEAENYFKDHIHKLRHMTTKKRNHLLCQLAAKEQLKTILPHEIITLTLIQAIRAANGEIDKVLKNWEQNPELDPRK